ncbi:MAG: hypothetical protein JNK60_19410 [Acidobacteria bacterium]|nr:hypothetical protein [Acidobacteriota bacterium]
MPDSKRTSSSGASGIRRVSALRLLPVPTKEFAGALAPALLGTVILSLLVTALVAFVFLERSAARGAGDRADDARRAAQNAFSRALSDRIAFVRALAADPAIQQNARKSTVTRARLPFTDGERAVLDQKLAPSLVLDPGGEAAKVLASALPYGPSAKAAFLTEANGIHVAGTRPAGAAVAAVESWWKGAARNGVEVTLPGPGYKLAPDLFSVAVALPEGAGVLQVLFALEDLTTALDPNPGDGVIRAAFDPAGRPVPLRGRSLALSEDPVFSPLLTAAGETLAATTSSHLVRGARLSPPLPSFLVAAALPRSGRSHGIRLPMALLSATALAGVLATALVLLPALRQTRRDLTDLLEYARRVGGGDLSATPPRIQRQDEIGALGTALVTSLESLRSSHAELERSKKSLEERVEARTAELHRLNQELKKRAEELATASRSKDEFLTNVSHELRTPLNSIIGLTQLVRDGHADTEEESHVFLDQVLHSSRHLLTLINDVLDLAKLEAGKVELQPETLDAQDVVEDVRKIVESLAAQKGLRLDVQVPDGLPHVRADRVRLRQVLVNLANNSIKFTSEGSVTVRVRTSDGRRKLLFEVEDTGIGIPAEKRAEVFEKFIQADAGTTRRFGGTGLGLPITRLLVEAMGGAIGIDAGSGGTGTRVWFTVPTPQGAEGR